MPSVRPAQLPDGMREHGVLLVGRPRSVHGQPRVVGQMLREAQDHRPDVLRHRGAAIGAHVAHGDAAFPGRDQVDVVGARGGQRDQFEIGRPLQALAGQLHLVEQGDSRAPDAIRDLRVGGRGAKADIARGPAQRRGIQVAGGDGVVIQKYGYASARYNDREAMNMKMSAVILLIAANVAAYFAASSRSGDPFEIAFALWPLRPVAGQSHVSRLADRHLRLPARSPQPLAPRLQHARTLHVRRRDRALRRTLAAARLLLRLGGHRRAHPAHRPARCSARRAGPTLGASGGVFGLLLAYALMFPHRKVVPLIPPIPMPAWLFATLYAGLELVLRRHRPAVRHRAFRAPRRHDRQRARGAAVAAAGPDPLGCAPMNTVMTLSLWTALLCAAVPAHAEWVHRDHRRHHGHAHHGGTVGRGSRQGPSRPSMPCSRRCATSTRR